VPAHHDHVGKLDAGLGEPLSVIRLAFHSLHATDDPVNSAVAGAEQRYRLSVRDRGRLILIHRQPFEY
jgi:hypothetical protein